MPYQPPIDDQSDKLAFNLNYDKDLEENTSRKLINLIKSIKGYYVEYGQTTLADPVAIAEVSSIIEPMIRLFIKYHENTDQLIQYRKILLQATTLETVPTLELLQYLNENLAQIMGVKHNFKDKTEEYEPWDKKLSKKLELPGQLKKSQEEQIGRTTDEVWEYYKKLKPKAKKMAFLISWDVAMNEGDARILLSGPNKSGKTDTALILLYWINGFLRNFWKVSPWSPKYLATHPERANDKLPKMKITKDFVLCSPDAEDMTRFQEGRQFITLDINEGMEKGTNLESLRAEVIKSAVKRFTTRVKHNVIIEEYQVAKRPTALMVEGMNYWIQKMGKKHFVLSMASHLVRKSDPYYFAELDKCRDDKEIGRWMTGKGKKGNPNYIGTFKMPKLGDKARAKFDAEYDRQQQEKEEIESIKLHANNTVFAKIKEFWNLINIEHLMNEQDIQQELLSIGYKQAQITKFMYQYDKYDMAQKALKISSKVI